MNYKEIAIITNKSESNIRSLKSRYKCSYDDLYTMFMQREETLIKCQELCIDLTYKDIYKVFKTKSNARDFMNRLYCIKERQVSNTTYKRLLKIINHIKGISNEY